MSSSVAARCMMCIALMLAGCSSSTEPAGSPPSPPENPLAGMRLEAVTDTVLTGTVGTLVDPVPAVRAVNRDGRALPGILISWQLTGEGGGYLTSLTVYTDQDGKATPVSWMLGITAGPQSITASVSGSSVVPRIVFTVHAGPGPAARVARVSGDFQTDRVGAALTGQLQVKVTDWYHNPVSREPVRFSVISGGGTIDHATAVSDSAGIAVSGIWTLGSIVGIQQVRAETGEAETLFTAIACDDSCPPPMDLVYVREESSGQTQIFRTDLRFDVVTALTSGMGWRDDPAWSPDGSRLAFMASDAGSSPADLYLMNADGSNPVRRAEGFGAPVWSPDGRTLAVTRDPFGEDGRTSCIYDCDLYLLSAEQDATAPIRIATMAAQPAWSPDGKKIAFVSLSGDDGQQALHIMNPDGSGVTVIVPRHELVAINHPAWSPDGRRIAFTKCESGACDIFTVNPDGSGLTQLTRVSKAFEPAWSPDGSLIAFTMRSDQWDPTLAYIVSDGSQEPTLLVSGHSPAWRPLTPSFQPQTVLRKN